MTKKQKHELAQLVAIALKDGQSEGKKHNPENPYPFIVGYYTGAMKTVIESLGFELDLQTLTLK